MWQRARDIPGFRGFFIWDAVTAACRCSRGSVGSLVDTSPLTGATQSGSPERYPVVSGGSQVPPAPCLSMKSVSGAPTVFGCQKAIAQNAWRIPRRPRKNHKSDLLRAIVFLLRVNLRQGSTTKILG